VLTNFERVKIILNQICPALDAKTGNAQGLMKAEIDALRQEYPRISIKSAPPIDYTDRARQAAYMYVYAVANADLIYSALALSGKPVRQIFEQEQVKVACVGGGPGTELLGIFKFMERIKAPTRALRCSIFDHHADWQNVLPITASTAPEGLTVGIAFESLQMNQTCDWCSLGSFQEADLVTFSYALSEAWRYNADGRITGCIDSIVSSMKSGSVILYSDNRGVPCDANMERDLAGRSDLKLLHRNDYTHMLIGSDEEKSVLQAYTDWLGGRESKRTGHATTASFVKK
jgi:hypothetical protein